MSDAPVDPRNEAISGEPSAESIEPIAPATKSDSASDHAPRPVQFSLSSLLLITAMCALAFAGGGCAIMAMVALYGVYRTYVLATTSESPGKQVALALLTAALVVVITALAASIELRKDPTLVDAEIRWTLSHLHITHDAIAQYHRANGAFPESLDELPANDVAFLRSENHGYIDVWENPVQYRKTPAGYELFSYGHDGSPGGIGLDADLDGVTRLTPVTFKQLFFETQAGFGVPVAAALAGAIAFLAFFHTSIPAKGQWLSWSRRVVSMAALIAVSVLFGYFMAAVGSIPSGH